MAEGEQVPLGGDEDVLVPSERRLLFPLVQREAGGRLTGNGGRLTRLGFQCPWSRAVAP